MGNSETLLYLFIFIDEVVLYVITQSDLLSWHLQKFILFDESTILFNDYFLIFLNYKNIREIYGFYDVH